MMNKGLELIEAHHLFQLPPERVDIVVHPQSIVHGAVVYRDGSVLAQLGSPDMRTPIAYALAGPIGSRRRPSARLSRGRAADLRAAGRAPLPGTADRARDAERGGGAPTVLNAANETAVHAFLEGRIGFLDIVGVVEGTLAAVPADNLDSSRMSTITTNRRARRRLIDASQLWARGADRASLRCRVSTSRVRLLSRFCLVLTVLVFVHEFGHYFVARRNGVRVDVFSIGFGPELFGWYNRAGTRWKVSAIPLGGYVKMFGDNDASSGLPAARAGPDERGRTRRIVSP